MATEQRLIYLDDAKEALTGWETDPTDEEIEYTLDCLPKVEAVEVVRCKDCKHYMLWEDSDDEKTCAKSIGLMVSAPDDFCSYGEKREV